MTIYLLDVNVLVPLLEKTHPTAPAATRWFERVRDDGWATCPIVENGALRILSGSAYPSLSANPVDHARSLAELCGSGQHHFWADTISPRDVLTGDMAPTAAQITDLYLLALASARGGKLATFDTRMPTQFVPGGLDSIELIPS